jgi:hypothetical protein
MLRLALALALVAAPLVFLACGGDVVVDRRLSASATSSAPACSCASMCAVIDACGESALCNCAAYTDAQRACLCGVRVGDCAAKAACMGVHGAGGAGGSSTTSTASTTSVTTTTSTTTSSSTSTSTTTASGGLTYGAVQLFTDVERVVLWASDAAASRCFRVQLALLDGPPGDVKVLPVGWSVERVDAMPSATACAACATQLVSEPASDAKGLVVLHPDANGNPEGSISSDVSLAFAGGPAWLPAAQNLITQPVPVGPCVAP